MQLQHAGKATFMLSVLHAELPANCMAALGVLTAAWANFPGGSLRESYGDEGKAYEQAILRHKNVSMPCSNRCCDRVSCYFSAAADSVQLLELSYVPVAVLSLV